MDHLKGITPVIAIILLLVIAISMVGTAFIWFGRVAANSAAQGENATQAVVQQGAVAFTIESFKLNRVTLRNTGQNPLRVSALNAYSDNELFRLAGPDIPPRSVGTLVIINYVPTTELRIASTVVQDQRRIGEERIKNEGFSVMDDDGRVWWFASNKDGTFVQTQLATVPNGSNGLLGFRGMDLNDFNKDGYLDILAGARTATGLPIIQRSFGSASGFGLWRVADTYWTAASYTSDYASADFDGDGDVDLVVDGEWHVPRLYRNKGSGSVLFDTPVDLAHVGDAERGRDVADFNNDGRLDMAVGTCIFAAVCDGAVYFYAGLGDGSFAPPVFLFDPGQEPYAVIAGEFTGNGNYDLVVSSDYDEGSLSLYRGNGDGTFQPGVQILTMPAHQMSTGDAFDFDHDGKLDLIFATFCDTKIYVAKGMGNGLFQAPVQVTALAGANCIMALAGPPVY